MSSWRETSTGDRWDGLPQMFAHTSLHHSRRGPATCPWHPVAPPPCPLPLHSSPALAPCPFFPTRSPIPSPLPCPSFACEPSPRQAMLALDPEFFSRLAHSQSPKCTSVDLVSTPPLPSIIVLGISHALIAVHKAHQSSKHPLCKTGLETVESKRDRVHTHVCLRCASLSSVWWSRPVDWML